MLLSELGQPLFKIGGQLLRGFRKACRRRPCPLRQRTPSAALAAGRRIDRLAEQKIESFFNEGLKCLDAVSIDADRKQMLVEYVYKLMKRKY